MTSRYLRGTRFGTKVGSLVRFSAAAVALWSGAALAAAWTTPKDDLVITQTSLLDRYDFYARNSSNLKLLEEPGGSVVQAGDVMRLGFLLGVEYGISDRVSAQLNFAFFYTRHFAVGNNVRVFTNSEPNSQFGLQDLTGNLKFVLFRTQLPLLHLAISPSLGFVVPMTRYDTSLNNPIGDGIFSLDPTLSVSLLLPKWRLFANLDVIYKIREDKAVRVGGVFPVEQVSAPGAGTGGMGGAAVPMKTGGLIQDQLQVTFEAGVFITDWLSLRALVRRIETFGGEDLTFEDMPAVMAAGYPKMSMFENSLAYDQDALFIGGGPYVQINDYFGIGLTYVHAVWFRNFPNMKTVVLTFSLNPQIGARLRADEQKALEAEQARLDAEAAAEEAAQQQPAPPQTAP